MPSSQNEIAVILHLYFPELWEEISSYLENLDGMADLYVSIPFHIDPTVEIAIKKSYPTARIIRFENRGRDIAPFLEIYLAICQEYQYICKIHSKISSHQAGIYGNDGEKWRKGLYEELLGSPDKVRGIISAFDNNPLIGLIGPANYAVSINNTTITGFEAYREPLTNLAEQVGIADISKLHYHFFAGSMFWFRSAALLKLRNLGLSQGNFEHESGAIDGTLAHILERFFPVATFATGYQVFDTDTLTPNATSHITPAYSDA